MEVDLGTLEVNKMNFDTISVEDLEKIAAQLGPYLSTGEPEANLGIGESLQLWTISLAEVRSLGEPHFSNRVEWQGVWHHQLRRRDTGEAIAYARSVVRSGAFEVRAVFRSSLASQIDAAINWLDIHHGEENGLVRLLIISDLEFLLLWVTGEDQRFLPLSIEPRSDAFLQVDTTGASIFSLITENGLRTGLKEYESITGISRATPPPILMKRRLEDLELQLARLGEKVRQLKGELGG
jgi:hypothetical protein